MGGGKYLEGRFWAGIAEPSITARGRQRSSFQPIDDSQSGAPAEFREVTGDERCVQRLGVGGDQKIIGADRAPLLCQRQSYLGIFDIRGTLERRDMKNGKQGFDPSGQLRRGPLRAAEA